MADRYVVTPPVLTTVGVAGSSGLWPVRRVFCVGRNYADHAREMGADPVREHPFFFGKPADAIVPAAGSVAYPPLTDDLQYEIELVVAIGEEATGIDARDALQKVYGYAVGVDLTRRDLQNEAKQQRRPWDWAKGFDASGPVTDIVARTEPLVSGAIWLAVNGVEQQRGDLADMIWPVADVVAFASQSVTLKPGDLIFTGTPAGVGPVVPGDVVTGGVDGVGEFTFTISPA